MSGRRDTSPVGTHLGRHEHHRKYLVDHFHGGLVRRTVRDEYVVDAEQRHQNQRGPDRFTDANWRGIGRVPVQFGQQHPHNVHQKQQAGQYRREDWHGQHPLAVTFVHPTPENADVASVTSVRITYVYNVLLSIFLLLLLFEII